MCDPLDQCDSTEVSIMCPGKRVTSRITGNTTPNVSRERPHVRQGPNIQPALGDPLISNDMLDLSVFGGLDTTTTDDHSIPNFEFIGKLQRNRQLDKSIKMEDPKILTVDKNIVVKAQQLTSSARPSIFPDTKDIDTLPALKQLGIISPGENETNGQQTSSTATTNILPNPKQTTRDDQRSPLSFRSSGMTDHSRRPSASANLASGNVPHIFIHRSRPGTPRNGNNLFITQSRRRPSSSNNNVPIHLDNQSSSSTRSTPTGMPRVPDSRRTTLLTRHNSRGQRNRASPVFVVNTHRHVFRPSFRCDGINDASEYLIWKWQGTNNLRRLAPEVSLQGFQNIGF